ncbi:MULTISPECIES: hypothetical protein [Acidithrix]|uniref:Uncharacterized protein n=1 Tax=Acidithrix ferrooxidans TaxID=1280514 RepID=A0A0D8HG83_9ACTN|nr:MULTISPECIES: hypothetical protein [Acidithrix]KJF16980.1 hypothetical protein AXFE_21830 [Acidithrix ferrooxidans]
MNIILVLSGWFIALVTISAVKVHNRGVVTSVSQFHEQLLVLGRTSTLHNGEDNYSTTHTLYMRQTHLHSHNHQPHRVLTQSATDSTVRNHPITAVERRTRTLFALLTALLLMTLALVISASFFALLGFVGVLALVIVYILALLSIKRNRKGSHYRRQNAQLQYPSPAPRSPREDSPQRAPYLSRQALNEDVSYFELEGQLQKGDPLKVGYY